MGHEYEHVDEVEVEATPEQVWRGIATGPGIDSWFMGRNEVDEAKGVVRQFFGGYEPEHRITAFEPGRRFAYRSDDPNGRFVAFEFLIEARDRASTVLRLASSGFLPGDDWADEYEAMRDGGELFFATLSAYLSHFAGRTGLPLTVQSPTVPDWPATWRRLGETFGLAGAPTTGDKVAFEPDGLPPVDGEVFFVNSQTVGVRTDDALLRFIEGFHGPMMACHCVFTPGFTESDRDAAEQAWQSWLTKVLS